MRKEAQQSQLTCTIVTKRLLFAHLTEVFYPRISSIMISRLMLNLRDPKLLTRYQDTIPTSIGPSELIFTTVIDTMALETTLQHTSQASESKFQFLLHKCSAEVNLFVSLDDMELV